MGQGRNSLYTSSKIERKEELSRRMSAQGCIYCSMWINAGEGNLRDLRRRYFYYILGTGHHVGRMSDSIIRGTIYFLKKCHLSLNHSMDVI